MRTLQFSVSGQKLSKDGDHSGLIAGTRGYLQTAYNFDSEWDGCRKAAVFCRYEKEYPVPIMNGKCAVPDTDTIPEWEQPGSTNPYAKGDKVMHNGKTWQSTTDNNVWEPGVYGWEEV